MSTITSYLFLVLAVALGTAATLSVGLVTKEITEGGINEMQQSINTLGQNALGVSGDTVMNPQDKLNIIRDIENQVNLMERQIQEKLIATPIARATGAMFDIQTDIVEQRRDILEAKNQARFDILTRQFPNLDPQTISDYVSEQSKPEYDRINSAYEKELKKLGIPIQ